MERKHLLYAAGIIGAIALSESAFSFKPRKKIQQRDQVDVWDGSTERLEAAHISHKKTTVYNSEANGRLLSAKNHYFDHFNRHGTETLGLNESQNRWSLKAIWARLTDEEKSKLPPPDEVGSM
mgnify:CR=1 FL=1